MANYSAVREAVRRLAMEKQTFRQAALRRLEISKADEIVNARKDKPKDAEKKPE